jgi:hypothetical protein
LLVPGLPIVGSTVVDDGGWGLGPGGRPGALGAALGEIRLVVLGLRLAIDGPAIRPGVVRRPWLRIGGAGSAGGQFLGALVLLDEPAAE